MYCFSSAVRFWVEVEGGLRFWVEVSIAASVVSVVGRMGSGKKTAELGFSFLFFEGK